MSTVFSYVKSPSHSHPPQVPAAWLSQWEGPDDPALYLRSLVAKTLALGAWEGRGREGKLLQEALDLAELFHPDTFLNALRQQTARCVIYLHVCQCQLILNLSLPPSLSLSLSLTCSLPPVRSLKCSMDSLQFVCSWRPTGIPGAKLPVKVRGRRLGEEGSVQLGNMSFFLCSDWWAAIGRMLIRWVQTCGKQARLSKCDCHANLHGWLGNQRCSTPLPSQRVSLSPNLL